MDMTDRHGDGHDLDLALALRRLDAMSDVPAPDPAREAALMAAFDAAQAVRGRARRGREYWGMAGLAAAAALLIAVAIGGHGDAKAPQQMAGEFVIVPAAIGLPAMESGSLVRIDLPVALLPSLGVTPPAGAHAKVKADVIVGQDGLPRAVRLVN
jgi:hypothetical protein